MRVLSMINFFILKEESSSSLFIDFYLILKKLNLLFFKPDYSVIIRVLYSEFILVENKRLKSRYVVERNK